MCVTIRYSMHGVLLLPSLEKQRELIQGPITSGATEAHFRTFSHHTGAIVKDRNPLTETGLSLFQNDIQSNIDVRSVNCRGRSAPTVLLFAWNRTWGFRFSLCTEQLYIYPSDRHNKEPKISHHPHRSSSHFQSTCWNFITFYHNRPLRVWRHFCDVSCRWFFTRAINLYHFPLKIVSLRLGSNLLLLSFTCAVIFQIKP